MPMEYIIPSFRIAQITGMDDTDTMNERLAQLLSLEEDIFIAGFHQKVQKVREKAWHDRHVKNKIFQIGYLFLLYDSKFGEVSRKIQDTLVRAIPDSTSYRWKCRSAQQTE